MDDGLAAIVERFLVEHVLVGLGNVRTRIDLLESERIAADEPPSLDLRAIAGQIDRLESHARALQFLLRDRPRRSASVAVAPALVAGVECTGGFDGAHAPTRSEGPEQAPPGDGVVALDRSPPLPAGTASAAAVDGTPPAPAAGATPPDIAAGAAPPLMARPPAEGVLTDPLLAAIAAELSRVDGDAPDPASRAPAWGGDSAGSPARIETAPVAPLLLTDPAVPPVRPAAAAPVFTSRRRPAVG
jgi:hypothetical protein